jgi:citrate lyase subunit beta/citryl-CoA lyase
MPRRSVLFSPGDQADKLRSAVAAGADVIVFDLEDGVPPDRMAAAHDAVGTALTETTTHAEVVVRVRSVDGGAAADLAALPDAAALDGLMVPKATASEVESLATLSADAGWSLPIHAVVESAAGVLDAEHVAAHPRTTAVLFGAEDLAGDIGATRTASGEEIAHARQQLLLAARAANVDAIDTLFLDLDDEPGLRERARESARLGYDGMMAIHPAQVEPIHDAFVPSQSRIAWAQQVLEARDETDAAVAVVDGQMVDRPQFRQAERILDRATTTDDS